MKNQTFEEKKTEGRLFTDRQNTKWAEEIKDKCEHEWQPLSIQGSEGIPDLNNARVYCVCMKCYSHTYVETAWAGFYLGSPDDLEAE